LLNNIELFPFLVVPLVLLMILELIFSMAWVPFYFRSGIPLISKSYRTPLDFELSPHKSTLENALKRGWFRPQIVFKQFSKDEFGFRNTFSSRSQVIGMIRVEPSNGRLTITGYLSWAFVVLILFGAIVSISWTQPWAFLGFLFIAGIGIFLQRLMSIAVEKIMYQTLKNERLILDDPYQLN